MTELPCLDAIDFSQPSGSSSFREYATLFMLYLPESVIRSNNSYLIYNSFISAFTIDYFNNITKIIRGDFWIPDYSKQELEVWLRQYFRRCLQYKKNFFCFTDFSCGIYYSIENEHWRLFRCKSCFHPSYYCLDESVEKYDEFFISQAKVVAQKEIPLIENGANLSNLFSQRYQESIEFLSGSKLKLERLTQLAAIALPELQDLKKSLRLLICYQSENDYYIGGVYPHVVENCWKNDYTTLSKQARQLFDLIYEYNSFTGIFCWHEWPSLLCSSQARDLTLPPDTKHYTQFCPLSVVLEIDIPSSPSNHERMEAALELQEWLQGKLPEEEIKSYFEAG